MGLAPSATTTMPYAFPRRSLARIFAHTCSTSNGTSGRRMTSADPVRPVWSAIHPTYRPMTSTTNTRWCALAVECSLSTASVAVVTAVSKPKL